MSSISFMFPLTAQAADGHAMSRALAFLCAARTTSLPTHPWQSALEVARRADRIETWIRKAADEHDADIRRFTLALILTGDQESFDGVHMILDRAKALHHQYRLTDRSA